jgi:hypothetical protein
MSEPTLISRDALSGQKVALSVSESADLSRLGLTEQHCRLVVAEVGRAIMLAGGTVVYGGHLNPGGYTEILMEEAQRFSSGRSALEITLAESEYRKLKADELMAADRNLGDVGRLTLVSESRKTVPISRALDGSWTQDAGNALTAMREYVASETTARLIVGGRLAGYVGAEPGVIEEARLTIQSGRLLLVAGGYGGAAAALAQHLYPKYFEGWAPGAYPANARDAEVTAALDVLRDAHLSAALEPHLNEELLQLLTISHRPADIARATVRLLSEAAN